MTSSYSLSVLGTPPLSCTGSPLFQDVPPFSSRGFIAPSPVSEFIVSPPMSSPTASNTSSLFPTAPPTTLLIVYPLFVLSAVYRPVKRKYPTDDRLRPVSNPPTPAPSDSAALCRSLCVHRQVDRSSFTSVASYGHVFLAFRTAVHNIPESPSYQEAI